MSNTCKFMGFTLSLYRWFVNALSQLQTRLCSVQWAVQGRASVSQEPILRRSPGSEFCMSLYLFLLVWLALPLYMGYFMMQETLSHSCNQEKHKCTDLSFSETKNILLTSQGLHFVIASLQKHIAMT